MNLNDFYKDADEIKAGYMMALFTDKIELTSWPDGRMKLAAAEDRLLEVRVFDRDREIKLFRSSIGSEFKKRLKDDREDTEKEYFDETQYLDIDMNRSKASFAVDKTVYTTGGGKYTLPIEGDIRDCKVRIRYYLSRYEDSGQARVSDWRVVGWCEDENRG